MVPAQILRHAKKGLDVQPLNRFRVPSALAGWVMLACVAGARGADDPWLSDVEITWGPAGDKTRDCPPASGFRDWNVIIRGKVTKATRGRFDINIVDTLNNNTNLVRVQQAANAWFNNFGRELCVGKPISFRVRFRTKCTNACTVEGEKLGFNVQNPPEISPTLSIWYTDENGMPQFIEEATREWYVVTSGVSGNKVRFGFHLGDSNLLDVPVVTWECKDGGDPQPQVGRCCDDGLGELACDEIDADLCSAIGGTFGGDGSICDGTCSIPGVEACCQWHAPECTEVRAHDCLILGFSPQGPGTTCSETDCPDPTVNTFECPAVPTTTTVGICVLGVTIAIAGIRIVQRRLPQAE